MRKISFFRAFLPDLPLHLRTFPRGKTEREALAEFNREPAMKEAVRMRWRKGMGGKEREKREEENSRKDCPGPVMTAMPFTLLYTFRESEICRAGQMVLLTITGPGLAFFGQRLHMGQ